MFSVARALVLGTVQGLTEFLPVSSSAHLAIIPWLFSWDDPGLAFDVALHLGTLLALLIYYWRDWLAMGASIVSGEPSHRRLLFLLITASLPGAIFGFLLERQAESIFRSPLLIGAAMAALGVALWLFDREMTQERAMNELTFADAILIGLSQALAIIPGVSRSGITITTGRAVRLRREDAANFSFLMATPIIAGAGMLKAHELLRGGVSPALAAGFISSAIFSLIGIVILVRFVRARTYQPFAWYRIGFAALIALIYLGWI